MEALGMSQSELVPLLEHRADLLHPALNCYVRLVCCRRAPPEGPHLHAARSYEIALQLSDTRAKSTA